MIPCAQDQGKMVGGSAVMRQLRETIEIAARTELPVLITGETGAGKELVAEALHGASGRRGAFVPVNVCAPSESMFEDSMFGHVRGAFTGATYAHDGYLTEADHGSLFLDEISELSRASQATLLRAVETRRFRPVGGKADARSEFRLIVASNKDLDALVLQHAFRADLLYRIRGIEIHVAPLRERREDVPELVAHFLRSLSPSANLVTNASGPAVELLQAHHWPGNVRELHQVVARAAMYARGAPALTDDHQRRVWAIPASATFGSATAPPAAGARVVARNLLVECLQRHDWNTITAAEELGVTRKTVYMRMRRLEVPVHRGFTSAAVNSR